MNEEEARPTVCLVNRPASASGFQGSQVLVFTTMGDYFLKEGDHFASTLDMAFPPPTNQSHMALLAIKTKQNQKTCFSQKKKVQKSPSWVCFHIRQKNSVLNNGLKGSTEIQAKINL